MDSMFINYGPTAPDASINTDTFAASDLLFGNQNQASIGSLGGDPSSGFLISNQPTDPTNTGDTGGVQNVSTPPSAGLNNPETGGTSSLGGVISTALNDAFAGWQLASQPKGTAKTITTRVGNTQVVSGTGALGGLFGANSPQQSQTLILILVIAVIAFLVLRKG
jgi:hypothetical protein